MILNYFAAMWAAIAPGVADHLWQSTVFAMAAALLALALRKHLARVRYAAWMAASLKFLVPFSLLVRIGSKLAWRHSSTSPGASIYFVQQLSQPFTQTAATSGHATLALPVSSTQPWLPILLAVWLCGVLIVISLWSARWWRIFAEKRAAVLLTEGRELATLRRLERVAGISQPMNILLSRSSREPGVFGIIRPVLLWPRSMSQHLDDEHLEAVIAHELCHVRRRDNLFSALHMLVEAVFWFHPLVWWLGARLIEERERACDEAVLALGSHRQVYAESILRVCEFCLSSPLTCVSGVTGADLKKRMVYIMTDRTAHKLDFTRKLLLGAAIFVAVSLPIVFGLLNPASSQAESPVGTTLRFTSVSIKSHPPESNGFTKMMMPLKGPVAFTARGVSAHSLIQEAYRVQETQLAGEPDWAKTEKYDIDAEADPSSADEMAKLSDDQQQIVRHQMLRQLLRDYFGVRLHEESRDLPTYELVIGDGGSKLQKTSTSGMSSVDLGELNAHGAPLWILVDQLSERLGRTVVDKTGLDGKYTFSLKWTPDADEEARVRAAGLPAKLSGNQSAASSDAPSLLSAVQEQLGLKLEPQTERVQVLVIDHLDQPAEH